MEASKIRNLEEFLEHFCLSLADELRERFKNPFREMTVPYQIELYGASREILSRIQHKMTTHFWLENSSFFNALYFLRESGDFPKIQKGVYFIDVRYFLELYEQKKSDGKNVVF